MEPEVKIIIVTVSPYVEVVLCRPSTSELTAHRLPGGVVASNESPVNAASRIVRELFGDIDLRLAELQSNYSEIDEHRVLLFLGLYKIETCSSNRNPPIGFYQRHEVPSLPEPDKTLLKCFYPQTVELVELYQEEPPLVLRLE